MKRIMIALLIVVLGILACGNPAPEYVLRGWTVTPTKFVDATNTPLVIYVEVTNSPEPTQTPELVIITQTSNAVVTLCVTASDAVYLRPSPDATYYPLKPLVKGTVVIYKGTHNGEWKFVEVEDGAGWINSEYLGTC